MIEAAKLDGCGHVRLVKDVVIPMARAQLATVIVLVAVSKWNECPWPLVITKIEEMRSMTVGLTDLVNRESTIQWAKAMASTVFVIAPLLIVFALTRKTVIEGVTAGATKG